VTVSKTYEGYLFWCSEGCGFVGVNHRCEQWCSLSYIPLGAVKALQPKLEAELALTTAQSVDRFNRWHDAEVEAAKWVAEVQRLVAANDRALGVEAVLRAEVSRLRQERDEWLKMDRDVCAMKRIAHAAGYREACDEVDRIQGEMNAMGATIAKVNVDTMRCRYPREQKGLTLGALKE
jgi:hypothetical protein